MTTTLEKIAAREQAIAATGDDLRAQIRNLTDRLSDLEAEAADLATARKVILPSARTNRRPQLIPPCPTTPSTSTSSPPSPAPGPHAAPESCAAIWTWAPGPPPSKACAPSSNAWSPPASSPRTRPACSPCHDPAPPTTPPTSTPHPRPRTNRTSTNFQLSEVAQEADGELVEAFGRLLPQLSASAVPLDQRGLARLLACNANTLLVARSSGKIVGVLTLVLIPLPSGVRGHVEDVVVDTAARGEGAGAALIAEALRLAEKAGARTVDLTSRPSRESANRLYERAGFQRRDTNLYRYQAEA